MNYGAINPIISCCYVYLTVKIKEFKCFSSLFTCILKFSVHIVCIQIKMNEK